MTEVAAPDRLHGITIRRATPDDSRPTYDVVTEAMAHLAETRGWAPVSRPATPPERFLAFRASALLSRPGRLLGRGGRRRARRLRDRRPARARLVPRRPPRPPGVPVAGDRRRDHPQPAGGGAAGEPADGRRGRPEPGLERALRPVRDVPRDAAGRGVGRPVVERHGDPRDPGHRHRTSWRPSTAPSSASPVPRTTPSGARSPGSTRSP